MGSTSREQATGSIRWKDREATRLSNGVVELIALTSGGHLAVFRFLEDGALSQNVLWEAPWTTLDAAERRADDLSPIYGPVEVRKFLAGYTGHSLCWITLADHRLSRPRPASACMVRHPTRGGIYRRGRERPSAGGM